MKALSKLFGSALVLSLAFGSLASADTKGPRVPLEVIAEAFSMDVDTLRAELQGGSTLKEIAANHGVSEEALKQLHPKKNKQISLKNLSDDAREYLASFLGLTVEELHASREAGVSFKETVEAHGFTVKEVFAALKEYKEAQDEEAKQ